MKKESKIICLMVVLAILLTSCTDLTTTVEDLLKEKYAETFTVVKHYPRSYGDGTYLVKSNQHSDLPFEATVYLHDDLQPYIEDTYGARRIGKKLSEYILDKIEIPNKKDTLYIHYEKMIPMLDQDPDEDIEKLLSENQSGSLYILFNGEHTEYKNEIFGILEDLGNLRAVVWIFDCDDDIFNKTKEHLTKSYDLSTNEGDYDGNELFNQLRFDYNCGVYQLKDGKLEFDEGMSRK